LNKNKKSYYSNEIRPPLEIINEANQEASNRPSDRKDQIQTPESFNKYKRKRSDNKKDGDSSKLSSLKNDLIVESEHTHKDFILNNISNIEKKNEDSARINQGEDEFNMKKTTNNENDLDYDEINNEYNLKLRDSQINSAVKPEEKLHYFAIATIIPEKKLTSTIIDDIMFQSNLKRLLNQRIQNHVSQNFCERFAICTKTTLKLYKSKEQFLKFSKPVNIIQLSEIKSVNRFSLNHYSDLKLHFFVIDFRGNPEKQTQKGKYYIIIEQDITVVRKTENTKGKKITLLSNDMSLYSRGSESI
jgi:hypothetical protein